MFKLLSFIAAALLSVVTVYADYFIKESSLQKNILNKNLLIGSVIYAITAVGWVFVMKNMKLSTLGVVYGISCIILLVLLGVFVYHEKISAVEVFGILLGLSSIAILYRFN